MRIVDALRQYLGDAAPGGTLNPEVNQDSVRQGAEIASMTPTPVGDLASAGLMVDALRRREYGEAAGNALGILPFMPAVGGTLKKVLSLPPAHGTAPLKEGHVRLYHQTDPEALKAIEREGLLFSKAKGIEGPKAIYAGEKPFYGAVESRPTLEFQVPKEHWDAPFVTRDVTPNQFIGAHYPWHSQVRYFEEAGNEGLLKSALEGKFDKFKEYEEALRFLKEKHGVYK